MSCMAPRLLVRDRPLVVPSLPDAFAHRELAACLLAQRGVIDERAVEAFLDPSYERDVHDPFLFRQMQEAIDRTWMALQAHQTIVIHGDYDADGVCASTLLCEVFAVLKKLLGSESVVEVYLPHRDKEGYGVALATIDHLQAKHGVFLLVTVDCGISNHAAIAHAKTFGIDTIVCDHHAVSEILPEAILLHPLVPGESYPFSGLCGTGVAFKFGCGLYHHARTIGLSLPMGQEKWLLDLVAIATVTDVVPLKGENRALERFGLQVLGKTRRVGLRTLLESARSKYDEAITTETIGFRIGPRLNAAGRMHHAIDALLALCAQTPEEASVQVALLESHNTRRQQVTEKMMEEIHATLPDPLPHLMVCINEAWSPGLVGLCAGKLVSEFSRPAVVVGSEAGKYIGSGRSIPAYNITHALNAAKAHLDAFGGHPQACGFSTFGRERIDAALQEMQLHAQNELANAPFVAEVVADARLDLHQIDLDLIKLIERFQPFGEQNREPVFVTRSVTVVSVRVMGKSGEHVRGVVADEAGHTRTFVGFHQAHLLMDWPVGTKVDMVYTVRLNRWNDVSEVQLFAQQFFKIT